MILLIVGPQAWQWKKQCDNHPDVTGILPCKTYPDGLNIVKTFLEQTKP